MHERIHLTVAGTLLAFASLTTAGHDAHASVSAAITFDALVRAADAVAVATPLERHAAWENGRIFTYTRLRIEQTVAGRVGLGLEAVVRTRGGIVGNIGQMVAGEAAFDAGRATLVFLVAGADGTLMVMGRAQGQYTIDDARERVIHESTHAGLVAISLDAARRRTLQSDPAPLARDVLHEQPLDDATARVRFAWSKAHAL